MCYPVNIKLGHKYDLYCGRAGKKTPNAPFGNHFIVGIHGKKGECCRLFDEWFKGDSEGAKTRRELCKSLMAPGIRLGCFCVDENFEGACHCWTYARFVNNGYKFD